MEVVLADVDTDRRRLIGRFAGMVHAPSVIFTQYLRVRLGARSVHPISGHWHDLALEFSLFS